MNKEDTTTVSTSTSEVDVDMNEFLGTPGSEQVMTGASAAEAEPEKKPTVLSNKQTDLSFLDKPAETEEEAEAEGNEPPAAAEEIIPGAVDDVIAQPGADTVVDDEPVSSENLIIRKMVEEGTLMGFQNDAGEDIPYDDYTEDDWKEVVQANIDSKVDQVKQNTPKEFYDALPPEMQSAAQYIANGGSDLKGLFKHLGNIEEVKALDPTTDAGQEAIVKNYLLGTNFGTEEDIQEEITSWKDLGTLQAKAEKFKPKLDKMEEQILNQKLAQQADARKKQEVQAEAYRNNIYDTLNVDDLNGIALDPKMQSTLFSGLTQTNYTSTNGSPTNLLGHLLEKHQWVEPNHALIAEATWLLNDPEGYREKIISLGGDAETKKIVKRLKTTQQNKIAAGNQPEAAPAQSKVTLAPSKDFFKRKK